MSKSDWICRVFCILNLLMALANFAVHNYRTAAGNAVVGIMLLAFWNNL